MSDQPPRPPILQYSSPQTGVGCPRCGNRASKPVTLTWWGGLVGPKMLHHVKCLGCGYAYNGKTGKSNSTAIAIYVSVGCVIGLVIGLVWFFYG